MAAAAQVFFPTLCYVHYALPSNILLYKFCKGHNEKDEQCIVIQIHLSIGYLPEEKSWRSEEHESSTCIGIWTTLIHHKKHSPNWTEQAISKVIRSKWRVSWLHVEAKKDTQISCSSWVLSTCKTKRKYEY